MSAELPISITENLRAHVGSIAGSGVAWLGAFTVNQQQVEFWLRSISFVAAIIASAVTVWSVIRKDRRDASRRR